MKKDLQKLTPKKGEKRAAWRSGFLSALRVHANITKAALEAGIVRQTAYDRKASDVIFSAEWDDALEQACDGLEIEARRRAEEGVTEDVYYQGEVVGHKRNYSDTLLIFMLKAHRPEKYRDRYEFTGKDGEPLLQPVVDALIKIYAGS